MISDVPALTAVSKPEVPMVATELTVDNQVPPEGVLLKVADAPTQSVVLPEIVLGSGLILTAVVLKQPVPKA